MDFATTHDIDTKQFTILYKSVVMGITIQEEESTACCIVILRVRTEYAILALRAVTALLDTLGVLVRMILTSVTTKMAVVIRFAPTRLAVIAARVGVDFVFHHQIPVHVVTLMSVRVITAAVRSAQTLQDFTSATASVVFNWWAPLNVKM
jgi:hypothetical protein